MRIDIDFIVEISSNNQQNYKAKYEYFDFMFHGKANFIHVNNMFEEKIVLWSRYNPNSFLKYQNVRRSNWQTVLSLDVYNKIKDLKKGDFFESGEFVFAVYEDTFNVCGGKYWDYNQSIHTFNTIFEYPLRYWQHIPNCKLFQIQFPLNTIVKSIIHLKPKKNTYLEMQKKSCLIFNYKDINYCLIITKGITIKTILHRDTNFCLTSNEVFEKTDLCHILIDNKVDQRMVFSLSNFAVGSLN